MGKVFDDLKIFMVFWAFMFWQAQCGYSIDDWPQWRGSGQNSLSHETGLPNVLDQSNLLWRVDLPGPGGASPVVWGSNVFVTTSDGDRLALLCFSIDGKLRWRQTLEGENVITRMDKSNSASPSPITDGKHVWAMMNNGIMHCFTVDGELVWEKDMQEAYGEFQIQFGMATTPVLDKGRLYFQFIHGPMREKGTSVGWVVALDSQDGTEVFRHERKTPATMENKHAYTSPVVFRSPAAEFLITLGGDYAIGHSLDDGSEIWRCGGINPTDGYNPFLRLVSSPVCSKDLIVIPSAKRGPIIGLEADSDTLKGDVTNVKQSHRWRIKRGTPDVATPVIAGQEVYFAREDGVFVCADSRTGKLHYEERTLADRHRGTPVVADGKIYVVGRDGTIVILKTGPSYEVISEYELGEQTTASPAISNGRIYIRTSNALYAFGKDARP